MKADSLNMNKVFSGGGDVHYVLPHFQREYAWEKPEWQTLLNDIFSVYELYDEKNPPEHFMGALVVINDGTRAGTVPVFRLVDGQQRLTSISLIICAMARLVAENEAYTGLQRKLLAMLVNQYEDGDLFYKLLPTIKYGDRASYCALLKDQEPPQGVESKIPQAFEYFSTQLRNRLQSEEFDPNRLFVILMTSLQVVFINLDHRERPYEIFESLNYKGKTLTQADLVRNYIAMKLPPERQAPVFTELWSPIEEMLLEKRTVGRSRLGELTGFLRHYFAFRSGVLINQDHVYSRFRDRGEAMTVEAFEAELTTLKRFAGYYDKLLRPQNETDPDIRNQLYRLNILELSTGYPFLLFLYDGWQQGDLTRGDFLASLQTVEIYSVRRYLNRDSTKYLNQVYPTLRREMDMTDFIPSLRRTLGAKNEPSDVRLRQSAETIALYRRDSYTRQKLALIFDTVNRHLSDGSGAYTVLDDDPTIEHIMPQTVTEAWKRELGPSWPQDYELLHTLGNLTIVTQDWNSQLSNAAYEKKRAKLAAHGLVLNQRFFAENGPDVWTANAIRDRAKWLAEQITTVWPQLNEQADGQEMRPKAVKVLGDTYPVASWRDVMRQTADVAYEWSGDDFEKKVVANVPTYFARERWAGASHELPNGWWVHVNLNAETIRHASLAIVEAAEIPDEEYDIELW